MNDIEGLLILLATSSGPYFVFKDNGSPRLRSVQKIIQRPQSF